MKILITGAAGFIGFHLSLKILAKGHKVVAVDNLNNYYDVELKKKRISEIKKKSDSGMFFFHKIDITDAKSMKNIFCKYKFDRVVHLAAQAGVRYSITNPHAYLNSNIVGYFNILENCRKQKTPHLIYASTSSVYGLSEKFPYNIDQACNHPIQFYAATKKSNEIMAHSYSHMYNLPTTGLRFFTVYGPWGRPDMSLFKFTKNIIEGKKIEVFNYGKHTRDFTYVDDIVDNIYVLLNKIPKKKLAYDKKKLDNNSSNAPFRILNIGNGKPEPLMKFIHEIEKNLKIKSKIKYMCLQKGDIKKTFCEMKETIKITGLKGRVSIVEGVKKFVDWYIDFYQKKQ